MPKFRLPVLNSLRAFEAAARHQSIRKACDELHVTHAAISRHIQKLEQHLGRDLFERHHRRIVLNNEGEILLNAVAIAFTHIQRAVSQLSNGRNPQRLVISVDPDFAGLWLVPRLADFYLHAPNTLIEIRSEKAVASTRDPGIDCSIQYTEAGNQEEGGDMLFRSQLFPVCSPALARKIPLGAADDLRHHVLLHDRSTSEWQTYLQLSSLTTDVNVSSGSIFSETALCLEAAARGQGVAMGDDFLAALYLAEGRLVRPFNNSFASKSTYYFTISEASRNHPAVIGFRDWVIRSIRRLRDGRSRGARQIIA